MSLAGTTAVVFGTTGNVGYGAALGLLAAGATVIAPTRTAKGAEEIRVAFADKALHAGRVGPCPRDVARRTRARRDRIPAPVL